MPIKSYRPYTPSRRTIQIADDFCEGRFLYYSHQTHDLGRPSHWLYNPIARADHHADIHWCDYPTFSPTLGDIKDVWDELYKQVVEEKTQAAVGAVFDKQEHRRE